MIESRKKGDKERNWFFMKLDFYLKVLGINSNSHVSLNLFFKAILGTLQVGSGILREHWKEKNSIAREKLIIKLLSP